ncbi:MAG TPA: MTH938/NDUFAF3 family protein [Steroidobacteraceae bacterium]|nr:MTH938/NDUFAF3 family protein [Steroidobacteraceae bacterium]
MKITQQREDGINLIRRYGADFIVIGENEIRESCIVGANSFARWTPRSVDELTAEHIAPLFALNPEIVVLSTGARQVFPRAALRAEFATRKIGLEVMEIGAACRTYNVLVGEERKVLVALLLPGPSKGPE